MYRSIDTQRRKALQQQHAVHAKEYEDTSRELLESCRDQLEQFTLKHSNRICLDPQFREKFYEMCISVGVDPIVSNKDIWTRLLGIGDFYIRLGIQTLHICVATRRLNGGIIEMSDCLRRLEKMRGRHAAKVLQYDVERSIARLSILGEDAVVTQKAGGTTFIVSLPEALSNDQLAAFETAQCDGFISVSGLEGKLGWTKERCRHVLDSFVRDGIVWVDDSSAELQYFFPSIFKFDSNPQI